MTPELRRRLAAKAFAHTAAYDATIAGYLSEEPFPETLPLAFHKAQDLRYGENPHQPAALYGDFGQFFEQLHGKELSYINILDIAAVQELIEEFAPDEGAALAIVKHTNPCGVGLGATPLEAWERAYRDRSRGAVWRRYRRQPGARYRAGRRRSTRFFRRLSSRRRSPRMRWSCCAARRIAA